MSNDRSYLESLQEYYVRHRALPSYASIGQLLGLKFAREKEANFLTASGTVYIDARSVGKIFTCKDANLCPRNLVKIYGTDN